MASNSAAPTLPTPHSFAKYARYLASTVLGAFVLTACSQQTDPNFNHGKKMSEARKANVLYFDVALFSYLDRPIFDVHLNGHNIGLAAGQPHRGEANGLMTGVTVSVGTQAISWRLGGPKGMAGNGDTIKAANQHILTEFDPKMNYLGVHIYPDNTVEVIPAMYWPEKTAKGEEINRVWGLNHDKQ